MSLRTHDVVALQFIFFFQSIFHWSNVSTSPKQFALPNKSYRGPPRFKNVCMYLRFSLRIHNRSRLSSLSRKSFTHIFSKPHVDQLQFRATIPAFFTTMNGLSQSSTIRLNKIQHDTFVPSSRVPEHKNALRRRNPAGVARAACLIPDRSRIPTTKILHHP